MQAAKVQASLRIRAVSPEPPLLAHTSSESRGTFRRKARSLAPLNGWACAVKICHDGMLEDTNSLDSAHLMFFNTNNNLSDCINNSGHLTPTSHPPKSVGVSATKLLLYSKAVRQQLRCLRPCLLEPKRPMKFFDALFRYVA